MKHFLYVPFTGLGLYGGFRGNHWLKNRIKVFKHFVIPSLQSQTSKNFTLWVGWRQQERNNLQVIELKDYLDSLGIDNVFTYGGLCFWDDKLSNNDAWNKLVMNLHHTMCDLISHCTEETILMTIQPSDDCYNSEMVQEIQETFEANPEIQAIGYKHGYMMNYTTGEVSEYNPATNPPFFTIKFPKEIFIDPLKHMEYTGPYVSHEYIGKCMNYAQTDKRGFLVGTHGENISTIYNHPYRGPVVSKEILKQFGLYNVEPVQIKLHLGKWLLRKMPHRVQRKLRYIFGEKIYSKIYNIRNR